MALLRELIQPAQLERCGDRSFPVLSMTMHDGIMLQSDRFKKSLASVDQSAYKVVRRNQLVVGFPIDEGVLYIQQVVDAGIMSPAYDVWNVDETKVDLRYFELCLHSPQSMMFYKTNLRGTTARRRSLPKETLLSLPVPVPSMERQREIASALDRLQALIRLRQHQLCALDQLIKAKFVEMFGAYRADCCSKTIGDYAQVLGGYAFKSDEFIQDAIPVIRISSIYEGKIIPDYTVCFSEQFWLNNSKYRAVLGDILMAMSGATTGKAGILRSNERLLINQRVACIRAKEGVSLPEFIYAVTQLPWMYDLIQEKSAGCAQPNISGKQIENMPIPEATYMQQKEFAVFASQVDKSKLSIQASLDQLETLKRSLMQKYFG